MREIVYVTRGKEICTDKIVNIYIYLNTYRHRRKMVHYSYFINFDQFKCIFTSSISMLFYNDFFKMIDY